MEAPPDRVTRERGTPPPIPGERRAEARMSSRVRVIVEAGGRSEEVGLRDVSTSGAFVEFGEPLTEGQRVRLHLVVPTFVVPIAVRAEVRWVQRGPAGDVVGGGVRFDRMRALEMRAWTSYLRSIA